MSIKRPEVQETLFEERMQMLGITHWFYPMCVAFMERALAKMASQNIDIYTAVVIYSWANVCCGYCWDWLPILLCPHHPNFPNNIFSLFLFFPFPPLSFPFIPFPSSSFLVPITASVISHIQWNIFGWWCVNRPYGAEQGATIHPWGGGTPQWILPTPIQHL